MSEPTTDVPRPNLSGYPTETNIKFIRHFIQQQNVDVSNFDRIRLCQWIRQLLKYIDKQNEELREKTEADDGRWSDDGGQQ